MMVAFDGAPEFVLRNLQPVGRLLSAGGHIADTPKRIC